ncbi:MAG: recombination protein RecR [Bacteroidales bacterium]|nr:recombination protein RecR [Bacteroidales bacterium]MBN2757210.1 recombination protein RecR [Bacteroidales bacterium]
MDKINYSSKLFNNAIEEFSKLPGIGKRTAARLVINLLKQDKENIIHFGNTLITLARDIKYCKICHNISDTDTCNICENNTRDFSTICIVESIKDVIAIENTQQYKGVYHVLGGILSPIDGIGPSDLNIKSLEERVNTGIVKEIILALSSTMEGDTTNFYIHKKLKKFDLKISTIARGIAFGDELEYADEITLGRSIVNRQPFSGKDI